MPVKEDARLLLLGWLGPTLRSIFRLPINDVCVFSKLYSLRRACRLDIAVARINVLVMNGLDGGLLKNTLIQALRRALLLLLLLLVKLRLYRFESRVVIDRVERVRHLSIRGMHGSVFLGRGLVRYVICLQVVSSLSGRAHRLAKAP